MGYESELADFDQGLSLQQKFQNAARDQSLQGYGANWLNDQAEKLSPDSSPKVALNEHLRSTKGAINSVGRAVAKDA